ncbi:ABC transporter ATP-binding protein [Bosea sp. Tri-44]|uniref:ABC transporter ATP-binding protein n=1 Tax=Bosea sp. Tri-44 TaxID=1972137 RepID=UPI0020BDAED4|nr:ABC transporter ATP-binding protein [Bosea sp. Tri-44]
MSMAAETNLEPAVPRLGQRLAVAGVSHAYAGAAAIEDVGFEVPAGTIAAILGPSGCGKSTMLRVIAGLLRPAAGAVRIGERDVTNVPARERSVGMVFQNYALFPHLTVAENIAYGISRVPRAERRERVDEMLRLVRLAPFADRLPRQLSGGQQQRVAVARALAPSPAIMLLDEPFAALDRGLRADLQFEFVRLQRSLGITAIIVTHDQDEAQSVADRLIVMNRGRVEQAGRPAELYDRPASLFVNGFVGHASLLDAIVETGAGGAALLRLSSGAMLPMPAPVGFVPGSPVVLAVRPEHVMLQAGPSAGALPAKRLLSVPQGPLMMHDLLVAGSHQVRAAESRMPGSSTDNLPEDVFVTFALDRCRLFPAP